jgi:YesN/AraC family two-component response regulator
MGAIMLQRGELDKALLLYESSFEKALKCNDQPFAGARAVDLANIYLKKENLPKTKMYIDLANISRNKTRSPRNNDLYYEVLSKYYSAKGDTRMSIIYMDSMIKEKKQMEEYFNATLLIQIEQKKSAQRQLELEQEKEMRKQSHLRLLILSVGFIIILSLLGSVFILYWRKVAAYRELVRKSQEWANTAHQYPLETAGDNQISEVDRQLFEHLQLLVETEHLYRQPSISIEEIAHRMKINRTYLSRAINNCTGKNFSTFINEYRIKEAVLLISDDAKKFSLYGFGYEVGFNDRKTFYTAFRKMTGLSPSEFIRNLKNR